MAVIQVERAIEDFRHAQRLLAGEPAWISLDAAIASITPELVIAEQHRLRTVGRAPKGGQTALNRLFERMLPGSDGWKSQPRLFKERALSEWKLDFRRDRIGVEVSFNHGEAIPWQFTRLNIAGESERVRPDARIDVGVVITADKSLKRWSKMDAAVGTFDQFRAWLREMKPILPIPILLIGLQAAEWPPTEAFPGTAQGTRGGRRQVPSEGLPANEAPPAAGRDESAS